MRVSFCPPVKEIDLWVVLEFVVLNVFTCGSFRGSPAKCIRRRQVRSTRCIHLWPIWPKMYPSVAYFVQMYSSMAHSPGVMYSSVSIWPSLPKKRIHLWYKFNIFDEFVFICGSFRGGVPRNGFIHGPFRGACIHVWLI